MYNDIIAQLLIGSVILGLLPLAVEMAADYIKVKS